MNKTITGIVGGTALVAGVLTGLSSTAEAAALKAPVTVTIKAEGTDMSGEVRSPRPRMCANNRTVKVFIVLADGPHLFASDTSSKQGTKYVWSTGNTGTEGRFFAKVASKPGCKRDISPTITVSRPDEM